MRRVQLRTMLGLVLLTAPLIACRSEGPAERAGRSIDRAADKVQDAIDPPSGPGERMGRSIDRATR